MEPIEIAVTEPVPAAPEKKSSALPIVATILSVIAIGFSAYGFFTDQQKQSDLAQLQSTIAVHAQNQSNRLNALQQQLSQLKSSTPLQLQQTLAEIRYFITVAHVQLFIQHDPRLALETLLLAQHALSEKPDTKWIALNQALQSDIDSLRTAPLLQTSAVFSEISRLIQSINTLSSMPSGPTASLQHSIDTASHHSEQKWYLNWLDSLKQLKNFVIIRHVDETTAPLVGPDGEIILKQNITLQLTMAQWALLHHNETIYQTALQSAQQWVTQYFVVSVEKNAVLATLSHLLAVQVNPILPTLNKTSAALAQLDSASISTQAPTPLETTLPSSTQSEMLTPHPITPKQPANVEI